MSDQNTNTVTATATTTLEIDQSGVIDGGDFFKGSDGKVSIRRVIGFVLIAFSIISLFAAMFFVISLAISMISDPSKINLYGVLLCAVFFIPGSIMLISGLLILKQITSQNIAAITGKKD
jgi:ABC-type transport system involved in multi-copper enzyme maturation permease subunit